MNYIPNIMIKEEFTHFCYDKSNRYFVVFSVVEKVSRKIELPYETTYLFDSAQVGNQIYFTGGGIPPSGSHGDQFFQTTCRVTVLQDFDTIIDNLANMNVGRANHTLVAVNSNTLYAIGGSNTKDEIPACEVYAVDKNTWKNCASLNQKKMWMTVCVVDSRYLYAFGGSTNLKPKETNMIECLDTEDTAAKLWTKIELTSGTECWPRAFFAGSFQVDGENVLVFGGVVNQKESDESFYFNFKTRTIVRGPKMRTRDAFCRSAPILSDGQMIIIGSNEGHTYSLADKKWALLERDAWNPETGFYIKSDTC
eukprot:TRINITY_DN5141_c0_g2_i9.p1 TRINITY_DN5141_c0_g2~~TRINITY_DN5141_c0_g2_i9.p1  ORF type:complete len:309 (-),score=67.08 TRINITY_DN5141_c0_g2_i9:119-1045(-)